MRKDLLPREIVAPKLVIEPLERREARQRHGSRTQPDGSHIEGAGKLRPSAQEGCFLRNVVQELRWESLYSLVHKLHQKAKKGS
jgi:hypothetical protein